MTSRSFYLFCASSQFISGLSILYDLVLYPTIYMSSYENVDRKPTRLIILQHETWTMLDLKTRLHKDQDLISIGLCFFVQWKTHPHIGHAGVLATSTLWMALLALAKYTTGLFLHFHDYAKDGKLDAGIKIFF